MFNRLNEKNTTVQNVKNQVQQLPTLTITDVIDGKAENKFHFWRQLEIKADSQQIRERDDLSRVYNKKSIPNYPYYRSWSLGNASSLFTTIFTNYYNWTNFLKERVEPPDAKYSPGGGGSLSEYRFQWYTQLGQNTPLVFSYQNTQTDDTTYDLPDKEIPTYENPPKLQPPVLSAMILPRYFEDLDFSMNFTGQHRCSGIDFTPDHLGKIVCTTGKYRNLLSKDKDVSQMASITLNDSLPVVELCNVSKSPSVFGVVSMQEGDERTHTVGCFTSLCDKVQGDHRVHVNGIGEGGIWVSNVNGDFKMGDYITSWNHGYGQKQDDDILHNYTVAKITMDCNFDPDQEVVKKYTGVDAKGDPVFEPIMVEERDVDGKSVMEVVDGVNVPKLVPKTQPLYIVRTLDDGTKTAFVGCTYHCS